MRARVWPRVVAAAVLAVTAAAQNQPYPVHETRPVIMNGPWLIAPSETSVSIVWITDTPCHSKVIYGAGGKLDRVAENAEYGLLPVGVRHVVRLDGLEPGAMYQYRVASTRVVKMKSYWPEKGLTAESPVYEFTTLDRRKPAVSFALITDTHEDVARLTALAKSVDWNNTDFLVHLGDAFHGVESEQAILDKFLDPLGGILAHWKPLLFARGNHDTRGPAARSLPGYIPIPEGRFYYARDHGPVHLVALDTGEDKDDKTNVYSDLNRFKAYREEEFAWLEGHVRTGGRMSSAPFRVLILHNPGWGWVDGQAEKWTALANKAGFDLAIAGHTHRFAHLSPGQKGNNYHLLVIGPENVARVEGGAAELRVTVRTVDGKLVESFSVPRR